jgi:hypothetical protein
VILGAKQKFLQPYALVLMYLVVVSATISAVHYFLKFWSQVDSSIKQRRKLRLLERREKTQDAPTH